MGNLTIPLLLLVALVLVDGRVWLRWLRTRPDARKRSDLVFAIVGSVLVLIAAVDVVVTARG